MGSMAFSITPRLIGDTVVLDLAGRLWIMDLSLREQVHAFLAKGYKFFIVNLEGVDYMDSSGLGQLVAIWTSVRTNNGNVALLRPSEKVQALLALTRLHVVFDIFHDEERAKVAVRRG